MGLTPLLNVEDTGRSLDFYCDHLGFDVKAQHPPEGRSGWARMVTSSVSQTPWAPPTSPLYRGL